MFFLYLDRVIQHGWVAVLYNSRSSIGAPAFHICDYDFVR